MSRVDFAKFQRQKVAAALKEHLLAENNGTLPVGQRDSVIMGQVATIRGGDDDGSWITGDLVAEGSGVRVPFVGTGIGRLMIGQAVRLRGEWREHPRYGLQFVAETVQEHLPTTADGIARWLAHNVPGCGPGRAQKLINRWGNLTLEVLLDAPEKAREVIGGKVALEIVAALKAAREVAKSVAKERELTVRLLGAGFTPNQIGRLLQHFKGPAQVEEVVLTRPYDLTRVGGIGFKTADKLALGMGVSPQDPMRLAAGVVFVVQEAQGKGDSLLPEPEIIRRAKHALRVEDASLIEQAIRNSAEAGTLVERPARPEDEMPTRWMTPRAYHAEERVANWVAGMLKRPLTETLQDLPYVADEISRHGLTDTQAAAVRMVLTHPLSILTGLPGAGKTTTVRTICRIAEKIGWEVDIAAPTGKAAARAKEVTGIDASTIHRLVMECERSESSIESQLLVVDEVSMQDVELMARLAAVVDGRRTRVLLVGDYNQLPSVAHGQVLRDLLSVPQIPRVRLTEILRQESRNSVGVQNSHRLLAGKPLLRSNAPDSDFWFADVTDEGELDENGWPIEDDEGRSRREQEAAQARILNAVDFLMRQPDVDPARDIQVLTPMKSRGPLGAAALNEALQQRINPDGQLGPKIGGGARARVGDRLIQTDKNNYEVPGYLCNGEQGVVTEAGDNWLTLDLGDRQVRLHGVHLRDLRHAWAITTHRSQGSEFRYVITPLHTSHFVMLRDPSLFYTALTRYKSRIVVVGSERMLGLLEKFSRRPVLRQTGLVEAIEDRVVDMEIPQPQAPVGGVPKI